MEKPVHLVNLASVGVVLRAVDFDAQERMAFFAVNEGDVARAKQLLQSVGQSIVTQTYVRGHIVLVTQGLPKDALLNALGTQGQHFEPQQPEKGTLLGFLKREGWKLRGGSSIVGQSLTLFSAARALPKSEIAKGNLTPKFDPATGAFAVLNLAANFINWIFGGQKEEDKAGLKKFDSLIVDEINRYQPGAAQPISVEDVHKINYMSPQEREALDEQKKPLGILQKNSVRLGEVGLRTAGSFFLMFNYREIIPAVGTLFKGHFVEAFHKARIKDTKTFVAGCGMMIGKMLGLFAETYDPNNPPKSYLGELRQKVFWTASSWTEMFAQSIIAYDRFANKKLILGDKPYTDYAGGIGNIILTVPPYPTRLVLPYGEKILDVDEIQARLLDELPKLPREAVPEVVARICARADEHMGEKSPGFSAIYAQTMQKFEKFHPISHPQSQAVPVEPAQPNKPAPKATIHSHTAQSEAIEPVAPAHALHGA